MQKINYHYTIPYEKVESFEFKRYNDIVSEECYAHRIMPKLDKIIWNLGLNPKSRQEVIVCHNNVNDACLISIQFQIVKCKLIVIANFRSQCEVNGRPNDFRMLQYIATIVMQRIGLKKYKIYVNVGNYHINNLTEHYHINNLTEL